MVCLPAAAAPRVLSRPTLVPLRPLRYDSPVQSPKAWHRDRVAEHSASLEPVPATIPVKIDSCSLCGIGIGPGHVETELYLYPVRDQWICDENDNYVFITNEWLVCCGGCARHSRRDLPDALCLIDYREWTAPLAQAQGYVMRSLLLLILFARGLPCSRSPLSFPAHGDLLPEMTPLPVVALADLPRRSFARGVRSLRVPPLTPTVPMVPAIA